MPNLLIIITVLAMAGCGPAISTSLTREAVPGLNFAALQADPDAYQGRLVVLGGEVIQVTIKDGNSLLEVSQQPLDANGRPIYGSPSGGAFLVESRPWLSPAYFPPRRQVTVAGTVAGRHGGKLLLLAQEVSPGSYPRWEKWYHPVPPEWYDHDPAMEKWFTPPHFDPWRPDGSRR